MNFNIYKVKHSKYTHIVISKKCNTRIEDIVWELAKSIPDGLVLLDMKASSKPMHPRFWEVSCIDGKLIWWRLNMVNQVKLTKGLVTYCDDKQAEETI